MLLATDATFAVLWGLAENQPFVDGNKRIALVVTLTFLELNGYGLEMSEDERVALMFQIADGLEVRAVADLFRGRLQPRLAKKVLPMERSEGNGCPAVDPPRR